MSPRKAKSVISNGAVQKRGIKEERKEQVGNDLSL